MSARPTFQGKIGRDWRDSRPWWPPVVTPPEEAPNVVLIVLDDVGFGQLGCYGSMIATPHIDSLADRGVRLGNFRTTSLCSPTRACLLTGRNHHRSAMGRVADLAIGFPGYWGIPPKENGYLSEILRVHGYATYAIGKWHLTPEDQTHMAARRDTWPLSRGFDRWYGFHGGETHQFVPALYYDNHSVRPPKTIEEGYHLSADLVDKAQEFLSDLRAVDVDRPFFLYFCTGACHSPHQAPRKWIEAYKGRFDEGWDKAREEIHARQLESGIIPPSTELSPRPPWVPAWEELSKEERRVAARFMECFAGFLSHTDDQIGRLLAFLEDLGELDNTLVILVSDNGASAEGGRDGSINDIRLSNLDPASPKELYERIDEIGGPTSHNNYPWGWTMAGNTPFKRWKREVHQGGVADPCIVSWPEKLGASSGEIRHQFTHAIDVLPTVLELVGLEPPEEIEGISQSRIDGISFAYALWPGTKDAPERHRTQYFEMFGSRAIYHDGWKAVTYHPVGPLYGDGLDPNAPFDEDVWELYDLRKDLSEVHDLASSYPDKVRELVELWWKEAEANDVLPLDNRVLWTLAHPKPDWRTPRDRFRYFQGGAQVPEPVAVNVRNRSHHAIAEVILPDDEPAQGVLLAMGSVLGGWSFHFLDGILRYVHNLYGKTIDVVHADSPLSGGIHRVEFDFEKDDSLGGEIRLSIDGTPCGTGRIERFTPSGFNGVGVGLTCGYEWGPAVGPGYQAPFFFNGTITKAEVITTGPVVRDPIAELAAILAEQ
jgi:arylsulfatase A-like enzyme